MDGDFKDDVDLAARVARGEVGAFEQFYAHHADLVFAFIYHQLNGARSDAEEVWQDTFIAAVRALPGYRGQSRLSSWLCGIARRKVADYWRQQGGRAGQTLIVPPANLAALLDRQRLPDEVLGQHATRAYVAEALAELPPDYRQALVARYADGCPVEEVARRLGRSYKAAESLLSRAKAALRDILNRGREGPE